MGLKKVMSKNSWIRAILVLVALLGSVHFAIGIGFMSTLWKSGGTWDGQAIRFSIPYMLLLLAFAVAFGFSIDKKRGLRLVSCLLLVAVVFSIGLFAFDICCERYQEIAGGGEHYYVIWWWWNTW